MIAAAKRRLAACSAAGDAVISGAFGSLQQAIQEALLGQATPEDALKTAVENSGL